MGCGFGQEFLDGGTAENQAVRCSRWMEQTTFDQPAEGALAGVLAARVRNLIFGSR
jgi:hypothetical protein